MELVQTATTTHQAYYYGVELWDNPAGLAVFPWSAPTVPIMAGISELNLCAFFAVLADEARLFLVAAIAQLFYAWRVWALAPNWVFKGMAVLITLVRRKQTNISG